MAYEELKAQIREYIKPNEQEEITGAIMQAILLEMVNQLGAEGSYLPLTGGNVTGGIVVSSDLSSPSHEALRLNPSGISVEKIASVGLNEILNVTANSITYSSYFPSETPNTLTISLGYTGVTLSGGVTAASFINSSVDASIRYQYLLKADGNVISISDIGGTDMQTVWEALAASTNEQINVSHLSTALNGYIHPTLFNLSNGDVLVYDSVGAWVNTSMSSFLSGYATETWVNTQLASYATQSWVSTNYLNKVSTNSGDIYINDGGSAWVLANLNTLIVGYGYITASALNGYATEAWVGQQGYLTSSALNGYIHPTITNLANGDILIYDSVGTWVNTPLSSFGFATQTWVGQQGYITASALNGYATQSWVTSQGYIQPTLSNLSNGDILIYDSVGAWYNTPISSFFNGYATQSWVTTQLGNYLPLTGGTLTGGLAAPTFTSSGYVLMTSTYYGTGIFKILEWSFSNYEFYFEFPITNDSYTPIHFGWRGGNYPLTIARNTYIGIKTTSPAYNLDVKGTLNATTIYQNGTTISSIYLAPTLSNLSNGDVLVYDSVGAWYNTPMSSFLTGYATESWVTSQGYYSSGSIPYFENIYLAHYLYMPNSNGTYLSTIDRDGNKPIFGYGQGIYGYTVYYTGRQVNICGGSSWNSTAGIYITASNNVGIGTTSPAYKLDVNGSANATTLYENGSRVITTANIGSQSVNYANSAGSANILGHSVTLNSAHSLSNGDILVYDSAGTWTNVSSGLSDIRQKDVINYNAEPTFEAVANAPAIRFTYKDNTYSFRRGVHVGSIAQYWQTTLPETVSMDNDGMLSMQYDVIALLSTISVAKKVSEHERRIILLERENEQLKKEIEALKSA